MLARDRFELGKNRYSRCLDALEAHDVQYVILDTRRDRRMLRMLQNHPRWTIDFCEGNSVLLRRIAA